MYMRNDYGFLRAVCITPDLKLADVRANAERIIELCEIAEENGSDLIVFPELCLTGYTNADLFRQQLLIDESMKQLLRICDATADSNSFIAVGLPVLHESRLYNCAAVISGGVVLGFVPKTYIPNHDEFYEHRWFSSGADVFSDSITIYGNEVPIGTDLLFNFNSSGRTCTIGVELCEDMWSPIPPSVRKSLAGAEIIINLSSSNELAGKADYRRELIEKLSGQQLAAYIYCSSGVFESSTDTVFGGHRIITENGRLLAEGERFERCEGITYADVDLDFIRHERIKNKTFSECAAAELMRYGRGRNKESDSYRIVELEEAQEPEEAIELTPDKLLRYIDPNPFVPAAAGKRKKGAARFFQSRALHLLQGCSI